MMRIENCYVSFLAPRHSRLTRVCSWESSQPPKLADGVQILALVLADVAEQLGIGFVNRYMLVRIQPSAPYLDSVTDRTGLS